MAENELGMELSPNFPFTLADHLNFAVDRLRSGIDLTVAISYDIRYLYQKEYAIAKKALKLMYEKAQILLPESEAVNIALHLINSEKGTNSATKVVRDARIVSEVDRIIEQQMGLENLPLPLQEMAHLRVEYPDACLRELGELTEPPVSRSGVNHRLKKLCEIAAALQEKKEKKQ